VGGMGGSSADGTQPNNVPPSQAIALNPEQAEQDAALLSGAFERAAAGDEGEDMEEEGEEEGLGNDEEQEAHDDHDGMVVDNPSGLWEEKCFPLTLTLRI
jgi:hypothetical protein